MRSWRRGTGGTSTFGTGGNRLSITGRRVIGITPYRRRVVEEMTDAEIRNKLCKDVRGGCLKCPVYDTCRYGPEAERRGLLK